MRGLLISWVIGIVVMLLFVVWCINSEKEQGIRQETEIIEVGYGLKRYDTKDGYVCFTYSKSIDCLKKEVEK